MHEAVDSYAHTLMEEVRIQAEVDGSGLEEAFARVTLEQLATDGHTDEPLVILHRDNDLELGGLGVSPDDRCLDLFAFSYSPRADTEHKVNRSGLDAVSRRLQNFLTRSLSDTTFLTDTSTEVSGAARTIAGKFHQVERVRLVIVTNARNVARDPLPTFTHGDRDITQHVWDLDRLSKWARSGSDTEPIVAEFPAGLPCLTAADDATDLSVYLAIVPGSDLARLYSDHGGRLLELNVRAFLRATGAVNRGIQETLRTAPERFLTYNNGITATASRVDLLTTRSGGTVIERIHDLQIVNGGQTTASISHADRKGIDVSRVSVQMKLTVIPREQLDRIVPQISQYSNTQNKVTASDLKANGTFHVELERFMRTLVAPSGPRHPVDTYWYYERARGQYANDSARDNSPAKRAEFKLRNPPDQKFTKADVAKFEHTWAQLPHMVSRGAEKNFVLFQERLRDEPVRVGKEYCQHLVAKAILFRRADSIVHNLNLGGYKINIVAYSISLITFATGGLIDLDRIWRDQDISDALRMAIEEVAKLTQRVITTVPPGRTHVGEWTKRPECWDAVRALDWQPGPGLQQELLPAGGR